MSSPQNYFSTQQSSLANSISTASSPESMISDNYQKTKKFFICRDPATVGITSAIKADPPLSECESCNVRMQFTAYGALAHLRRTHFMVRSVQGSAVGHDERKDGEGSWDWPPVLELNKWLEQRVAIADETGRWVEYGVATSGEASRESSAERSLYGGAEELEDGDETPPGHTFTSSPWYKSLGNTVYKPVSGWGVY